MLNQKIQTPTNAHVTLLDLFINRRYRSGLNFLINTCKINVNDEKREMALNIIETGSSVPSIYESGSLPITSDATSQKKSVISDAMTRKLLGVVQNKQMIRRDQNYQTLQAIHEHT